MTQFNIKDYGAVTGQFCTKAIQQAIDAAEAQGGGTVVIPQGEYLSKTIYLKSNITLHLCEGATLKASPNVEDYDISAIQHNEFHVLTSFIYAENKHNIRITGSGCIDLSGRAFFEFDKTIDPINTIQSDEIRFEESPAYVIRRPTQPIFFHNCRDIKIDNVKIIDAPSWCLSFSLCEHVKITGITIDNHLRGPNNDGIHLCSCKNAIISDCDISSGDDCIAVSAGVVDWDDAAQYITVTNCNLRSRSAAVRLGHEASKVSDVILSNLNIYGSNRGICIFAKNGGYVKNVVASNLIIHTAFYAGGWWGKGEPLVICASNSTGLIENIKIQNVVSTSENGVIIKGKDKNIKNIALANWSMTLASARNRKICGRYMDLAPNEFYEKDFAKVPYIYAESVERLALHDFALVSSEIEPECDTNPYFNDVDFM